MKQELEKKTYSIGQPVSKLSFILIYLGFIPLIFLVLKPSLKEFLILYAVDLIAFFLINPLNQKWIHRKDPHTKKYFPNFVDSVIEDAVNEHGVQIIESLSKFPSLQAQTASWLTVIKLIPAYLVIVFYFQYQHTELLQFLLALAITMITTSYFFGVVFWESHQLLSQHLDRLSQKDQIRRTLKNLTLPDIKKQISPWNELLPLIAISFFVSALLMLSTRSNLEILVILGCGMIFIGRLWFLARSFWTQEISRVIENLETLDEEFASEKTIIHTLPALQYLDIKILNLLDKLKDSHRKLTAKIFKEIESSRFEAIGQTASLIVHDISSPIHALDFAWEQLQEDSSENNSKRMKTLIQKNLQNAKDLIQNLRSFLKNQSSSDLQTTFRDAHLEAMRFLNFQTKSTSPEDTLFTFDEKIADKQIKLSKADLIHVLFNIYSNSQKSMIQNQIRSKIDISLVELTKSHMEVHISDIGPGFPQEWIERFSAQEQLSLKDFQAAQQSLGLRLIRNLVERYGGSMLLTNKKSSVGALIILVLPLYKAFDNQIGDKVHAI